MSFSVSEVVAWTGGRVVNGAVLGAELDLIRVERPMPLGSSNSKGLAYFFSKEYQTQLPTARPGILITGEPFVQPLEGAQLPFWKTTAVIACTDPYFAMAVLSEKFAAKLSTVAHIKGAGNGEIHPTAVVSPKARLGAGVQIGPHCVVEAGAKIGAGSVLYAGCYVGPEVEMGESCVLFPHVTLYEWTCLGNRVRIHSGAVLGADGFGYAPKRVDGKVVLHGKIYHLGRVIVGDDVELGAMVTIDRGTLEDTVVGAGSKFDDHVHIGHNSRVGEGVIICGGTCLGGGSKIGAFAYVAGMSGIAATEVGAAATVGAMTLVTKDVPPGGTVVGNPQREHREHFKVHAHLNRIALTKKKAPRSKP